MSVPTYPQSPEAGAGPTEPSPVNPPAGWYPDPAGGFFERFWNGAAWTDQTRPYPQQAQYAPAVSTAPVAPGMPMAPGAPAPPGPAPALVVIGWLLAFFMPVVGLIIGLVVMNQEKATGGSMGKWMTIVSVAWFVLALLIVAGSSAPAVVTAVLT
jgi:hypothetical protein